MGGGGCFPESISNMEMDSWAHLTGNFPTPWELETLKAMDRSWRLGYGQRKGQGGNSSGPTMQHQALGEYCKGERVDECRKLFGSQLDKICATCPN